MGFREGFARDIVQGGFHSGCISGVLPITRGLWSCFSQLQCRGQKGGLLTACCPGLKGFPAGLRVLLCFFKPWGLLPRGSYSTACRYPEKGVGYEAAGKVQDPPKTRAL